VLAFDSLLSQPSTTTTTSTTATTRHTTVIHAHNNPNCQQIYRLRRLILVCVTAITFVASIIQYFSCLQLQRAAVLSLQILQPASRSDEHQSKDHTRHEPTGISLLLRLLVPIPEIGSAVAEQNPHLPRDKL
jgi:hypothetical protein